MHNITQFSGHQSTIRMIKIFNNDENLITVGDDGICRLFDIETQVCFNTSKFNKALCSCQVSFDNNSIFTLTNDGDLNVIDPRVRKSVASNSINHICTSMNINFSNKQ